MIPLVESTFSFLTEKEGKKKVEHILNSALLIFITPLS